MTAAEVGLLVKAYREVMEWSQETLAELFRHPGVVGHGLYIPVSASGGERLY
jgi:hypothetical protein